MATNVRISITSSNLTADAVSIVKEFTLQDTAGSDLDLTSGLANIKVGTSNVTVHSGNGSVDEAYVFVHNPSSTQTDQITIRCGSTDIGVLQGGDSAFLPFDQTEDLSFRASAVDKSVEYQIFRS